LSHGRQRRSKAALIHRVTSALARRESDGDNRLDHRQRLLMKRPPLLRALRCHPLLPCRRMCRPAQTRKIVRPPRERRQIAREREIIEGSIIFDRFLSWFAHEPMHPLRETGASVRVNGTSTSNLLLHGEPVSAVSLALCADLRERVVTVDTQSRRGNQREETSYSRPRID